MKMKTLEDFKSYVISLSFKNLVGDRLNELMKPDQAIRNAFIRQKFADPEFQAQYVREYYKRFMQERNLNMDFDSMIEKIWNGENVAGEILLRTNPEIC